MPRILTPLSSIAAALALSVGAAAQTLVVTHDSDSDCLVGFSPFDGSLVIPNIFSMPNTAQVGAILVGNEIWVSEQTGDRIVRYDACGNVLGTMGPTLSGGGMDNIRGLSLINGIVYVTNDGPNNGATANSLVTFDTAGNYLSTIPVPASSPFSVIEWQGDLLVASDAANDDIHRYTTAGVSVGTFHNSASLNFAHQLNVASDGNVWCAGFSTNNVVKLDATTGAVLFSFPASGARGVYELLNGNVMWTNGTGAWVYDIVGGTSTAVHSGGNYHLNLATVDSACHRHVGAGCHDYTQDNSNLLELFATVADAKAALDGNALQFVLTGNGYVANWLPGVAASLYVAPSGGATIVANVSTGTETFTPSAPIPVPFGATTDWTLSSEGILTAGAVGNQGTDISPTLAETASAAGLAFYTWCTQNPTETGSGKFKWEEVGGVLYVTADGVEFSGGTPTAAPSTYQWQIDMATGTVTMLWTSFSVSNSTADVIVGCTLAGTGITPLSQTLSTASSVVLAPDQVQVPLTLTAAPAPVINPSTLVTYTANGLPEFVPGSGVYLGTMFLSVNPLPGGFDLTGILTTVPGCNAYIATLDLDLGAGVNVAPTLSWNFTYDNVFFAPGNLIGAQAIGLFDPAFPLLNGESGGFLLSNGVVSQINTQ